MTHHHCWRPAWPLINSLVDRMHLQIIKMSGGPTILNCPNANTNPKHYPNPIPDPNHIPNLLPNSRQGDSDKMPPDKLLLYSFTTYFMVKIAWEELKPCLKPNWLSEETKTFWNYSPSVYKNGRKETYTSLYLKFMQILLKCCSIMLTTHIWPVYTSAWWNVVESYHSCIHCHIVSSLYWR